MTMLLARRAAAIAALFTSTAAFADTLTPIAPPPGFSRVAVLGINNAGWTTGSVHNTDANSPGQAFLRAPDGTYTIFSTGAALTQGRNVSNSNQVIGYGSADSTVASQQEFLRDPVTGGITILTNPATMTPLRGIAQGINDAGAIVGNYQVTVTGFGQPRNHGYILSGGTLTDIAYPDMPGVSISARGIANDGTVVGFAGGTGEAFVRTAAGAFTFFRRPEAATITTLSAINNFGTAIGGYDDAAGNLHAFLYNIAGNSFTDITVPGASSIQAFGLNDSGQYVVSSATVGSFIFTPGGPVAPDGSAVFLPVSGANTPEGTSQFSFGVTPGQTYFIDPALAIGFEYQSGTGPLFASVTLPTGIAPNDIFSFQLWNGSAWTWGGRVSGGTPYTFASPVDRFRVYGIPTSANIDAANPTGFVTGLTFAGAGHFNGLQISLVPEPSHWALLLGGFGLAGWSARRRRRFAHA